MEDVADSSADLGCARGMRRSVFPLWYELGGDDLVGEKLSEAEILDRLESLRAQGYVEIVTKAKTGGHSAYSCYRVTGVVTSK